MFQSHVLFETYTYSSGFGERDPCSKRIKHPNSTLFPEGERVTATSLGQRPSRGDILIISDLIRVIHRVPLVERVTATSLVTLLVLDRGKKINRKNAPNELFLVNNNKKKEVVHGA